MLLERRFSILAVTLGAMLAATGCQKTKETGGGNRGAATAIEILPGGVTVEAGYQPAALGLKVIYSDGSGEFLSPDNGDVTWTSSDETVATVEAGKVVGVAKGTCTIVASYKGLSTDDSTTLQKEGASVKVMELVGLQVVPANATVQLKAGKAMHAVALYSDHTVADVTAGASWSVHDTAVATVSGGAVSGVGAVGDSTRLTASYHGRDASTAITLAAAPPVLTSLAITGPLTIAQLTSGQLTATATFDDASTADVTTAASWSAPDPTPDLPNRVSDVVAVSGGAVSGLKAGTATIKATYKKLGVTESAQVTVTVLADKWVVKSVAVSPASMDIPLDIDAPTSFAATAIIWDGADVATEYSWDVTNEVAWSLKNAKGDAAIHAMISGGEVTTKFTPTSPAFAAGSTKVVATFTLADPKADPVTGDADLNVAGVLLSVAITPAAPSVAVGTSVPLKMIGTYDLPAGFTYDLTKRATWFVTDGTPTNDTVLVVDNSKRGVATGLSSGPATVDAYFQPVGGAEFHDSTTVTVP
jgi:hypothetical protein